MGHEVIYCTSCRSQIRGTDLEKEAAFKIGGFAYCSKCLPEALKSLPPERVKELFRHLQAPEPDRPVQPRTSRIPVRPPSESSAKPPSTRILAPSTRRRAAAVGRRGIVWAAGGCGVLGLVALFAAAFGPTQAPPPIPESRELNTPLAGAPVQAKPVTEPPKVSAGAKLLAQARDYARDNPADLAGQLRQYEQAVRELQGLDEQSEADRELRAVRARLTDAISAALSALEAPLQSAMSEEKFEQALELIDRAGTRYPPGEWKAASDGRIRLIRESAAARFAILKEQAVEARRNGNEQGAKLILDRVAAWGLPDHLTNLRKTLNATAPPPPAKAPLAAEAPDPTPKREESAKKEEPVEPAPAPPPPPPVKEPPALKVVLTAPRPGIEVTANSTIVLVAEVQGMAERVEFFEGAKKLGEKTEPPFEWPWKASRTGSYSFTVKAIDRMGATAVCEPVPVTATLFARKPQKPASGHPKVDQRRVDEAIRKGVEYLRKSGTPGHGGWGDECVELVLLALLHAGVPEQDPYVQKLLQRMLDAPLRRTYNVSLQAVVLERLDRVRFQKRIFHCAQFLVDNQLESGDWGYSSATELGEPEKIIKLNTPTGKRPSDPEDGKRVRAKVVVKRNPAHLVSGHKDASNAQYAALGLRACHDSGIVLPRETIELAVKNWRSRQLPPDEGGTKGVATGGVSAPPIGWGYVEFGTLPSGAMTAGAVGALAIYGSILGQHWRADKDIQEGLSWMAKHFTPATNPNKTVEWQYYWLYAVERVGMLLGIETLGSHEWYPEGANHILDRQKPDGSWETIPVGHPVWNTCFAILFLKRGTRPLTDVESVDRR